MPTKKAKDTPGGVSIFAVNVCAWLDREPIVGVLLPTADRDASLDALHCIALYVAIYVLAKCTQISFVTFFKLGPTIDSKGQFLCIIYLHSHYLLFVGSVWGVVQRAHGSSENREGSGCIVSCPIEGAVHCKGEEWRG